MTEKSLLSQIRDEAAKAKREAAKARVKTLYADYSKAQDVLVGIEQQIVAVLKDVGEDEATIRAILGSD